MTAIPPPPSPDFDPALVEFPEPPFWPKPVGIISIVWATISLTCAGCGSVMYFAQPMLLSMAKDQLGDPPAAMQMGIGQLLSAVVGLAWAALLLFAGIACVRHKAAARPLHLVYAIGGMVLSIAGTVVAYQQQTALADWVKQNPTDPWAKQAHPEYGMIGVAVGVILGFAWPVFCLVWFGLVKRKPDDITGGVEAPAA